MRRSERFRRSLDGLTLRELLAALVGLYAAKKITAKDVERALKWTLGK